MNAYFDTSSLAKLYVEEEGSERVRDVIREGEAVTTSLLSYVEMGSMVFRHFREKRLSKSESSRLLDVFESDWEKFGKVPLDQSLLKYSHRLLRKHPLRALDAVHLASALSLQDALDEPVTFFSADKRLLAAARQEKLEVA